MTNLADTLTLVIPTHYRHHYLSRVLTYYQDSGLAPLVIDSTDVPYPDLARFPGVDYRHCPDMPFLAKITRPVMDIATPYTVFCADDSFILPRAAAACVEFLEAHPDHHAAHGRQISVTRASGRLVYEPCYTQDARLRIDSDDPAERLRQIFQPYSPTFYAVHRTGSVQEFVRTATGRRINDVMLELVSAMTGAIGGKHAVLPLLYHVTEIVPSILDAKKRRLPGADDICDRPEHREQLEDFVAALSDCYARRTGSAPEASRAAVLASIEAYLLTQRGKPRRPFWKKLPRYLINSLAGLGWQSGDFGSLAETRAFKARQQSPDEALQDLMALFDETARAELSSIRAVMDAYYAGRP